jgi:hypothetical protein
MEKAAPREPKEYYDKDYGKRRPASGVFFRVPKRRADLPA